ncbi:MAG: diacylglycerol kinase, partial [Thermoleophilia bacterium]|nr:diacylglycerol kinase [Thermoleophilia bacterium]
MRHQRNMKIHLVVALLVLVTSVLADLSRLELIAVFLSITFVLMAELINTAVEAVVDMITGEADPRARVAKDVAAGAVLVAAINALLVGYLVFAQRLAHPALTVLSAIRRSPAHLTFVALAVVVLTVIGVKATRGKGSPLSGGLPSGHAAVAFAGWT